ncbi:MAG: efflux RND transporter periplasmic adaptor subunit [Sphingobacteriales bacterium]|jgi:Cu(I)/Ag(I) efflux system membrane fusion protein|nr:efflux RND transporter periplasmic adaptor subunit [Sphingobacteriales bacterium]
MKIFKIIGILLAFVITVTACINKDSEDHSKHNSGDVSYYTCSMHPQIRVDKPGKCPICHMDLIPIKNSADTEDEISLSEQQIKLGNITTQTIEETKTRREESYTGILTYNQNNIKTISARTMGRIEKLYFKTTGNFIKVNDPLYVLYSEDIAIAKQDYLAAFKQLSIPGDFGKNAKTMMDAAEQKLLFYGLTNKQIESLQKNNEVSPYITFYSTYSGYITEITVTEGSYVMEGSGLIRIADLSNLWLEAQINANYANQVSLGQNASISFTDFPDKSINSKITFINPEINPDSRLLLIRLEIPNQNVMLKPGMQAVIKFKQPDIKGLFIPTDAVIREENATYIWVEKRPGVFENRMVETGAEINGMIEIKSEMDKTKKIVITGAYAINSEYKFRKGSDPMEGMKM